MCTTVVFEGKRVTVPEAYRSDPELYVEVLKAKVRNTRPCTLKMQAGLIRRRVYGVFETPRITAPATRFDAIPRLIPVPAR